MATAMEIMDNVPPSLLDSQVEDIDIEILAKEMTEWELLAPYLDLTPAEVREIAEDYAGRFRLQKREALRIWKEKLGRRATYRRIITIMCEQGTADLADTLKNLLLTPKCKSKVAQHGLSPSHHTRDMTGIFYDYLVDCYSSLPHPSSLQWPTSMTSNQTYVELNLFDVPTTDNNPKKYSPITLTSLFSAGNSAKMKRKVILVEGIAGAGKTTLTWYGFKEWAEGRLFEDIKLLIHVPLSDQSIHSATKLADFIPHHSDKIRTDIAKTIIENSGRGVCFWFDGFDEAPPSMWSSTSFLYQFISGSGGRVILPNVHIVLTSRPGISLKLASSFTGKVIIQGLVSLDDYFAACLPNKGAQLIEALKLRPELYNLCYLPLHAAILAYIYDIVKDNLPTTLTGLFYPLMQNFIVRHMLSRTNHQDPDITDFPANLPDDICSSLDKVSRLAFENIIHGRKIFDRNALRKCDLDSEKINDALGLLRVHTKFTLSGPAKQFSFAHLSFQEFLAAFHISKLEEAKQVVAINIVFHQNPTSPVLAFYAGLTKLTFNKVRKIYFKILSKPFDKADIVKILRLTDSQETVNLAHDPRRQLLCLMNGMYEAQYEHLFTYVNLDSFAKDIGIPIAKEVGGLQTGNVFSKSVTFFFSYLYLYPTDCLSIGYFIRHACSKTESMVFLDLSTALVREIEIKALIQEMHKPASSHNVYFNFDCIALTVNSLNHLSMVFNPQSCLCGFDSSSPSFLDEKLALKYLIERYARSNCKYLRLNECNSQSLHHIILMLMCQTLLYLALSCSSDIFAKPTAMHLFSEALKYSRIEHLILNDCCINDESLLLLGSAVCHKHCPLTVLNIGYNTYTKEGLTQFLMLMLKRLPSLYLQFLWVDHYNDEHSKIVKIINICRQKNPTLLKFLLYVCCTSELHDDNEYDDQLMRLDLAIPISIQNELPST